MNWFRNFMIGRYGLDKLNIALLVLSIILTFISSIADSNILLYISYVPLIWCMFRMFSRNTTARAKESYKFLEYYNPTVKWIKNQYLVVIGTKTHKYFKCPNCNQMVKVPKGKGKISITCPKCYTKFTKKS